MLRNFRYIAILLLVVLTGQGFAQHKKSSRNSLRQGILRRDSMLRSLQKSDTSLNSLLRKVEYYSNSFNQISVDLNRGFDTVDISQQLPKYKRRINTIKSLIDNDRSNTLRYLYAIRDFLTHTGDQLDDWQDELAQYNTKLVQMRSDLSEIQKDTTFRTLPNDTSLQRTAILPIKAVLSKHGKLDSLNKVDLLKIGLLQNRLADIYLAILDEKDLINTKIRNFSQRAMSGEYGYIWDMHSSQGSPFKDAVKATIEMNAKLLKYLVARDALIHWTGVGLFVLFLIWVLRNRRKIFRTKTEPAQIISQAKYTAKLPIISALIFTTAIQPYFYDHPPAIFLECLFLVNIISIVILVYKTAKPAYYKFLLKLLAITFLYALSNLFVEVTDADRIINLLLSLAGAIIGYRFLQTLKLDDERPPHSITIIQIYVILQALAFVCNAMGWFTLSKIIGVTITFNLWQAVNLYLLVQILMQCLFLQIEANKGESIISSYLDFAILQRKFRNALNIMVFALWIITLAQNLSVEDWMYDSIGNFLNQSSTVGGTSFTFGGVIIFVAVIWLSTIVSRVITYFYDFAGQQSSAQKRKNRTSILLIKISVFALGFLLAVAASGVPLDKITIILSAFGVGIGFGLQNIVNNLVSGLILAFEKPVQVGDFIEVANRSGTIMEIGIRSSKIAAGNGAEIIVPNGDLISQHVVNWTLTNSNRQVELIISVAYGSDVEKVRQLLKDLLTNRDYIMQAPGPSVFLHQLNESSVDFRLFFWVQDINTWLEIKSRMLGEIYNMLRTEGIEMPFPQREVHLHLDKDAAITVNKTGQDQDQKNTSSSSRKTRQQ